MDRIEVFQILGIEMTKNERDIKNAYREKLTVTNPEDNPEGFKRLREAYEEACRLAKQSDEKQEEARDESVSGLWMERVAAVYQNIHSRQDIKAWEELFSDDCFLSLEEEENCRFKLLRFLMDHFRLPGEVWKLLDKKLEITTGAAALREKFPADFIHYILNKCERGEDVDFCRFEGEDEAPYDLFLQYYDRCWQALQKDDMEQAGQSIENADALQIRHPVMEVCRGELLEKQGRTKEALALLEKEMEKYPGDAMLRYNTAEMYWRQGMAEDGALRRRSVEIYQALREENDDHYMANMRLTEWYYDNRQFKEAKKCAEKVLSAGIGDEFLELLVKVNQEIEKELEEDWRRNGSSEAALELCWCYLQDGKITRGIMLATEIEKRLPPGKDAEWNGLMAKLYIEAAEYEDSIIMTRAWEEELHKRLLTDESEEEKEKDRDRLRQACMIRMQCCYALGFRDEARFAEAVKEGEAVMEGTARDAGVLYETAQIYVEMQEYEKCEEAVRRLTEEYQVYAAFAILMEAYRRQLDAGGVIRTASLCIQYFPAFAKAYEYMAKVYLDLEQPGDLDKVLADAEKNGIKSDVLEAYKYQKSHKTMELEILNNKLKVFRREFRKPLEEGNLCFYEAGLSRLTEYLYQYPQSYMFVERGIFHRDAHHYKEAREDFEKALIMNPTNPYALNGLSFVYKYTGEYEKALVYIKKAILYMDQDMSPTIYTDMADLYSLLGDYERKLAACRQYQEITKDESIWFLNQLAEAYDDLGMPEKACGVYAGYAHRDKWRSYEERTGVYIHGEDEAHARELLEEWCRELKQSGSAYSAVRLEAQGGLGMLFARRGKVSGEEAGEYCRIYGQALWTELMFGEEKAVADSAAKLAYYLQHRDISLEVEGDLADIVYACIVRGMARQGKEYADRLQKWLREETFSGKNKYFNREKGHLHLEVLAAWYTEDDQGIQKLLEKDSRCGFCQFCANAVCSELESLHILFLLRQGKPEEARARLERDMELLPANASLCALKCNWPDRGGIQPKGGSRRKQGTDRKEALE